MVIFIYPEKPCQWKHFSLFTPVANGEESSLHLDLPLLSQDQALWVNFINVLL
jgi:hypothetical protein